jgi:hypothetical protein
MLGGSVGHAKIKIIIMLCGRTTYIEKPGKSSL